jgi:hypothetical protein
MGGCEDEQGLLPSTGTATFDCFQVEAVWVVVLLALSSWDVWISGCVRSRATDERFSSKIPWHKLDCMSTTFSG